MEQISDGKTELDKIRADIAAKKGEVPKVGGVFRVPWWCALVRADVRCANARCSSAGVHFSLAPSPFLSHARPSKRVGSC